MMKPTKREREIARRFKVGESIEQLAKQMCNPNGENRELRLFFMQAAIQAILRKFVRETGK